MIDILLAGLIAAADPSASQHLAEARQAIVSGRLNQARAMIAKAMSKGSTGPSIDRLAADLEFASGNCDIALARYLALFTTAADDGEIAGLAGISALKCGETQQAGPLLTQATRSPHASAEAWNALGVHADLNRDWDRADRAYREALRIDPASSHATNNLGWSLLLRGRWPEAAAMLQRAAHLDPSSGLIAQNLELANAGMGGKLPERGKGESDESWSARLNDAGVIASLQGDRAKAIAAFSRALETRPRWFERASNNLAAVEATP